MQPYVSVITLGVANLARSKRFYVDGFGWQAVFENETVVFYELNGVILGTFLNDALEDDMNLTGLLRPGAFALAHNVRTKDEVAPLMERLVQAGGTVTRPADAPAHGGFRGYLLDPDEHPWEIAWNPGFKLDEDGNVSFGM
jgi:uncharacterized protein